MSAEECFGNVLYHSVPDVSAWGKLYHRSVMERVVYPEGMRYEDTYVFADVLETSGKLAYTPKPLYFYRVRPATICWDSYTPSQMEFLPAVDRLCERVLQMFPVMKAGTIRRRMHAALSIRRYFVNCPPEIRSQRDALEKIVRHNAWSIMKNRRAPVRDKIAVLAVLCGPWVYDLLWKIYSRSR